LDLSLSIKIVLRMIAVKQFPAEIFCRESCGRWDNYLSEAPHAADLSEAPHAADLSEAPHAVTLSEAPHAVFLSEPPQAVPQAEDAV
jgi:hypothetical protein